MIPTIAFLLALHAQAGIPDGYTRVELCSLVKRKAEWAGRKVNFHATYHTDGITYGYLVGAGCYAGGVLEMVYERAGDSATLRQRISSFCNDDQDIPCPVQVEVEVCGVMTKQAGKFVVDPKHIKIGAISNEPVSK